MRRTAFLLLTLALLTVPVCAVQLPGELLDALPEEAAALAEGEGITEEGVQLLVQSFFDALRASLDRSLRGAVLLALTVLLTGAADGVASALGENASRFVPLVGVLCVTTLSAGDLSSLIGLGTATMQDLADLTKLLLPTMAAIKAGKDIALANKETLVCAGGLVMSAAKQYGVRILPVDSEHSAIFQCLEINNRLEKVILTASGGPFRTYTMEQLQTVTKAQALKHPNWEMGAKITIDSAAMMNKGFEVIEARWLLDLRPEQIEVLIHPRSVINSMVQFADGAIKAQLGTPDMHLPIQYALSFPERLPLAGPRVDFPPLGKLEFFKPDTNRFPNLELAFECLRRGGNAGGILNAANEVAVAAFLKGEISFIDITRINTTTLEKSTFIEHPSLEDYRQTDQEAREIARSLLHR